LGLQQNTVKKERKIKSTSGAVFVLAPESELTKTKIRKIAKKTIRHFVPLSL
jgi:hypothetical protein